LASAGLRRLPNGGNPLVPRLPVSCSPAAVGVTLAIGERRPALKPALDNRNSRKGALSARERRGLPVEDAPCSRGWLAQRSGA
jgi:hypothetical protein